MRYFCATRFVGSLAGIVFASPRGPNRHGRSTHENEATRAGRSSGSLAFEGGRDGFCLARWLGMRDIESYVIHSTSVAVPREHRRANTDRLEPLIGDAVSIASVLHSDLEHAAVNALEGRAVSALPPQGARVSAVSASIRTSAEKCSKSLRTLLQIARRFFI